ncbi:hypothetical protein FRB99_000591, partial [Tulasnella sp. 403]
MIFACIFSTLLEIVLLAPSIAANGSATFDIIVGGDAGLVYTPPVVYPDVGDTLRFWFRAKNHSVTQSSFEYPCTKLDGGFDSG